MADYDRYGRDNRGSYGQGERARREDTDNRSGAYGEYIDRPRNRDRDDDRTVQGSGAGGRNFAERTGDEVRSWVGDDDAERRRERDRQQIGRYPGEGPGERLSDNVRGDDRYGRSSSTGGSFRDDEYRSYRGGNDDRTVRGSGYGDRNFAERTGDEVRSWLGDETAEQRRERDRQQIGRYPGDGPGERLSDNVGGRRDYDDRSGNDRQGYRGSQGGYGQSGNDRERSSSSFGRTGGNEQNYGGGQSIYGRSTGDQSGYGGMTRSSQGDTGRSSQQTGYGSYGGEGRFDRGPQTSMAGPGAYSQSPTGGAYGQTGFQASRNLSSGHSGSSYDSGSRDDQDDGRRHNRFEPSGQDYQGDDRGFVTRAADEVRSWFGDEDAERRRELDQSREDANDAFRGSDDRSSGTSFAGATGFSAKSDAHAHDPHYSEYRKQRQDELDRDYEEYKKNRQSQFGQEFSSWRTTRQPGGVTTSANAHQVREHQKVVGSDGQTVGSVDHIHGADIKLTKNESPDGKHHLIPMSWVDKVENNEVKLTKSAADAKREWRDAPEGQGQGAQLNSGLAGSLQKGQDTTTSATSSPYSTTGTTASGAV